MKFGQSVNSHLQIKSIRQSKIAQYNSIQKQAGSLQRQVAFFITQMKSQIDEGADFPHF